MTARIRDLVLAALLLAPGCAHAPPAPSAAAPPAAVPTWAIRKIPATEVVAAPVATPDALRDRLHRALAEGHADGWRLAGPPMVVVPRRGTRSLAVPVAGHPRLRPPFALRQLPATRVAEITVRGTLPEAEARARDLARALVAHGLTPEGPLILVMVDDPAATAPSVRRTRVWIPIR